DRRGVYRREDTGQDASENDHDRDQTPYRVDGDLERLAQRDDLAFREILPVRDDQNEHDQRKTQQERRDDPAHEQLGDGHRPTGGKRIDDHVVRGRQQQRLQRARNGDLGARQRR